MVLLSDALEGSFEHAGSADLCIVFGSSLTVTPAAEIPEVTIMISSSDVIMM